MLILYNILFRLYLGTINIEANKYSVQDIIKQKILILAIPGAASGITFFRYYYKP